MIKKIITALSLTMFLANQTYAQAPDVGIYVRSGQSSFNNPQNGQTYNMDYSTTPPQLRGYYGGAWHQMTPAFFNYSGSGAPTVNTDNTLNYSPGSCYYDTVGKQLYFCSDATTGAAVWTQGSNPAIVSSNSSLSIAQTLGSTNIRLLLADGKVLIGNGSGNPAQLNISGDATLADTGALTLATVNSAPGTYTNATVIVDGKGRSTGVTSGATPPSTSTQIIAGVGLTGGGTLASNTTISLLNTSYIGGNGSDGAGTLATSTITGPIQKNYTSITVGGASSITFAGASPLILNSQGSVTITGTMALSTHTTAFGGFGGLGAPANAVVIPGLDGAGPGAGRGGLTTSTFANGGGGGGGGAPGGYGGGSSSGVNGGTSGGAGYYSWMGGGSGGGGGGCNSASATGGNGGKGGITCIIAAGQAISITSTAQITNQGQTGVNGTASSGSGAGGAGGAGGFLWLVSSVSVTTISGSSIDLTGGAGGNGVGTAASGAGGGGSGALIAWSPSNTLGGTLVITTASGGTGSSANSGGSGANVSATTIVGNPCLPLMVWFGIKAPRTQEECKTFGDGNKYLATLEAISRMKGEKRVNVCQRDLAREYANGDLNLYTKALAPGFDGEASCLDTEAVEVLKDAA